MHIDECSVELGFVQEQPWVWRHSGEGWLPQMQAQMLSKGVKITCWAGVLGDEVTDLFFLEEDPDGPSGHGVTTRTYLAMLEVALPQSVLDEIAILVFDSASIHKSNEGIAWLEKRGINWEKLPPYSPNLNIIEHCWFKLKENTHSLHPELLTMSGSDDTKKAALKQAMYDGRQPIRNDRAFIWKLVESILLKFKTKQRNADVH